MDYGLPIDENLRKAIEACKRKIVRQRLTDRQGWLGDSESVLGYLTKQDYADIVEKVAQEEIERRFW